MILSRRIFILAAGLAAAPAQGQQPTPQPAQQPARTDAARPDPTRTLRTIYANVGKARRPEPFTRRLKALHDAAMKRSRELDEPVSGMDFDYAVNGQDSDPGLARTVRYQVLSQDEAKAVVKVTFTNGGPQELHYHMALENGRWLIDDVRSLARDNAWTLSELLRQGAATPRS